jgi:hypothetical protein
MKITRMPVRAAVLLAGVSLAVAGVLAGAGPAVAGGRSTGDQRLRAAALALVLRHGAGVSTASLPAGARKVPKPGMTSALNGVFCTSSANCWAVGDYTPAGKSELNEALHWNGKKWAQVTVPSPGGNGPNHLSELFGVRCTSARYCWAVGYYSKGKAELNEALHWNGRKWSAFATPTPGGTLEGDINQLFDVVCPATSSCWAGGEYGVQAPGTEIIQNEALHWNGKTWSFVHTPNPSGSANGHVQAIDGVRCTSTRNCLAVGTYGNLNNLHLLNEALRWNGTRWSKLATPNPGGTTAKGDISELIGLGCTSASNCWAAGSYGNFGTQTFLNQLLHWNGKKWSQATTPDPDGTGTGASNILEAVNCVSPGSCWAVGIYGSITTGSGGSTGEILNEALRWTGTKWTLATTPNPAGTSDGDQNELFSIRCTSPSYCWTVGEQERSGGSSLNQALHWNGARWSVG